MKIAFKAQLPGKCSSRKRGPSGTTECKALSYLLWKQPPAQSSRLSHWKGVNAIQLSFSAPLSTQQSSVRLHPRVSERMWAWHLGGFSARSLEREYCFSRNSRKSASSSAHSTSQFDLHDNIKVWSWTSHGRHWGSSEILSPFRGSQKPKGFYDVTASRVIITPSFS